MKLNRDSMKKIMFLIVFTILVLAGLFNLNKVWICLNTIFKIVFPFVLGGAIAFIINMPMKWIERVLFEERSWKNHKVAKKMARPVSLILAIVCILSVIGLVLFVVIPQLGETLIRLGNDVAVFWPQVQEWAIQLFQDNPEIVDYINNIQMNWNAIVSYVINFLKIGAGTILGSTVSVAKGIVNAFANFAISTVFAFYLLMGKEKLKGQMYKILNAFCKEKRVHIIVSICSLTHRTFSNFLTGQCVEAVILGMMFFLTMKIFRFPYALLVGVVIAFTALIPIFGAFIGCAVGTFFLLMENPMQALAFIVLFFVLQQIEGNLIYPHVVGSSVGLPSIWVLVAVTIGGSLMGIVGMLIFIPLISVLYTLLKGYINKRLNDKKIEAEREKTENETV